MPTAQESIKKKGKKKKKEKRKERNCPCVSAQTFLSIKEPHFLPSVFSPFCDEKFLVGPGRKHPSPPFIFLSPHSTKHILKKFLFLFFFPKFFIHLVSPPNKHTFSLFPSFWTHSSLQSLHGIRDVERWSILQRTRSYNKISKLQLPVPSQCMLLFN